ncbi:NAC domain-containing protein 16-like isoform X1 [Telopea speciosissima]|uniref:NAC domain-containing protein 16-like isoform X1 n=1 Tax=Telopea speciosissima TaxID=54955 RepID=UPI001CC54208|nr:NAC domain-containing protein 16-like isoform X1 [Telopea speciosissima]
MKVSNPSHDDFGNTKWPPGFRFHPTDEELILYYLKKKICRRRLRLNVIRELDVYKCEPEELQGQSLLKTGDRQWFFFSPRDRRYPNGSRVNRATRHGHWKSTGKDRNITWNNRTVGVKKTLVFYQGRAPSGDRTDWVMHEYTIDEEELKRCPSAQDSFALYKVFKKSGPGPKNGEQYGAPFREDEWADDDDLVDVVQPLIVIPPVDSFSQLAENGREEILGRIVDDHKVDQPQIDEFAQLLHQVGGGEETLGTMMDPSLGEAISTEPRIVVLHPGGQQSVAHASCEVTQSATSNMYSCEASEVSSTPTISKQDRHAVEDDYLEMNDLWGPDPSFSEMGNACEDLQLQETNGLDGSHLYFETDMFLQELGPIDSRIAPQSYFDTLEADMASQLNYQMSSQPDDANNTSSELWTHDQRSDIFASPGSNQVVADQGMTQQSSFDTLQGDIASQLNYQLSSQSDVTNNVSSELWTYDQRSGIFASPGSNQVVVDQGMTPHSSFDTLQGDMASELNYQLSSQSDYTNNINTDLWTHEQTSSIYLSTGISQGMVASPTSGLVNPGSSTNLLVEARQNEGGNEGDPQDSWITSKLWAFLESIPTTPASASESALINRAFERMSSFSRVRINANNIDVTATGSTPNVRRGGGSRGIGFLSFFGVMRAVLWVLMLSTTVKVLSTFLGRFVAS